MKVTVIPRDLRVGDKIERLDRSMNFVLATISKVIKIRRQDHTAYKVYFAEYDALPDHRKPWAEYRHFAAIILQPSNRITVERDNADDL